MNEENETHSGNLEGIVRATSSDSKLSPREIQQRIRSGETVEHVAHAAGTSFEYAARFAAPILDELAHVLEQALETQVITAEHSSEGELLNFGQVIAIRLELIFNAEPQWSIWKDLNANRWIVQLTFESEDVEHDARWWYEPKRQYLSPLNPDAENLSSVSPNHPSRLRVLSTEETPVNVTRFDSAAFRPDVSQQDTMPHTEPVVYGRTSDAVITELYRKAGAEVPSEQEETEELLFDLNKKRGERNDTPPIFSVAEYEDIDIPLDDFAGENDTDEELALDYDDADYGNADNSEAEAVEPEAVEAEHNKQNTPATPKANTPQRNTTGSVGRRGRQQVPSWDEIVFGAKPEEF
ncbi:MAG: septation protein SepH [Microbacteriaceae bacterium]